jgi:hypothetical protein
MLNCQYIGHNQAKSLEAYEVWKESILLLAEFFILTVLSFCSKMVAWLHLSMHNIDCLLFEYFMENLYLSITNHLLLFFFTHFGLDFAGTALCLFCLYMLAENSQSGSACISRFLGRGNGISVDSDVL